MNSIAMKQRLSVKIEQKKKSTWSLAKALSDFGRRVAEKMTTPELNWEAFERLEAKRSPQSFRHY